MTEFFIGLATGAVLGVIFMALFCAASDADDNARKLGKRALGRKSE